MCFMRLIKMIRDAARYALDTVAPPDPTVRRIEEMSVTEFLRQVVPDERETREDSIVAFFPYRTDLMKAALVELKTFRNRNIERLVGTIVCERLIELALARKASDDFDNPLLVPVPMTRKSLRKRGWNQCELIVREITREDKGKMMEMRTDVLVKIRETADQVGRTRSERIDNQRNCLAASDGVDIKGRNVIVLDDIVTTGATLREAQRALLQAGARAVICVAVAY